MSTITRKNLLEKYQELQRKISAKAAEIYKQFNGDVFNMPEKEFNRYYWLNDGYWRSVEHIKALSQPEIRFTVKEFTPLCTPPVYRIWDRYLACFVGYPFAKSIYFDLDLAKSDAKILNCDRPLNIKAVEPCIIGKWIGSEAGEIIC